MIGSLSSRGISRGSGRKLAEFPQFSGGLNGGFARSKDGFICWTAGDNGNPCRGSGVSGMGVDIVDGELGSGVRSG